MKYILVAGGVISGIGKGVIASSIGTILKSYGLKVTSIKIDPYINIDAGTFSPYEHGEVFVLDDGGEVDLDLGNYERFLDVTLNSENNITTGKIYRAVIEKERRGDFLGKTVQVIPHITDEIQSWVERVAQIPVTPDGIVPEICIIELGGTIGDIEGMAFVEAFRQFQNRIKRENFCCVYVSLVPQIKATGEHKTKPTQSSVRELRSFGLSPDLIVCRSEKKVDDSVKDKISNFCHVDPSQVLCLPDVQSLYHVPIFMAEQGLVSLFATRLQLSIPVQAIETPYVTLAKFKSLADHHEQLNKEVSIALVGKYTKNKDSYASVIKSLQHAALACNYKLNIEFLEACDLEEATRSNDACTYHAAWSKLCKTNGLLVPGGFGNRGIEGKIAAIKWAREHKKPFLGICLGFQCAVIEYARSVLGFDNANSTEVNPATTKAVVIDMPEHNTGKMGGTMRLGRRTTIFNEPGSTICRLYNKMQVDERHRHRYEVNPEFIAELRSGGLNFVGHDDTGNRMEILELEHHPYFVGVQFHPEYLSRPLKPSPPYLGLLLAACGKLEEYLDKRFHLYSPFPTDSEGSDNE